MTEPIIEDIDATGRVKIHVLVLIIYAALIVLVYSQVVFDGKSLNPTLYQPHGITAGGVYGEKGRTPVNSFNIDLATPAFYEFPINKLVGDMYREKRLPLWNPYQAGGTPLAAQYSTRAFFPYQIAEDLAPVRYWDYFMLGRLFIAGFFTYLFIVSLGAGPWSAFLGGLFYMFSGAFTWFINLEQLANTAMMIPILLLSMEYLARPAPRAQWVKVKIVIGAAVFALTLLAGQPETALYVLALAFLYYVFRALSAHGLVKGITTLPRLGFSFVTGLLLSMPLILPFIELVQRGAHIHPAGGKMGIQKLVSWQALFNVITPSLSYFPANPETIKGTSLMARVGEGFFRFLPINGVWDNMGGYTGVLPLFLILAGLFISPLRKKMPLRKELLFFFLIAAFIVLKNAGVYPFILLGEAPMFDRVWSLRWAGPVWIFGLAVAAATGFGLIEAHLERAAEARERGEKTGAIPVGAVFIPTAGIIGGAYFVYSFIPSVSLYMHSATAFNDAMRPFVLPSIIGGSLLTLFVIAFAFYITYFWKDEKRNIYALIILAVLELWWCVPRGYAPETLLMKWLPLFAGFAALVFFFRQKMTFAFIGLAIFFGGAYLLDTMAPSGLPPFDDAFRPAPYVSAIRDDAGSARPRVAGAYGALFPNFASALRLDDVRYVNSVTPREFQAFREKYLHSQTSGELAEMSLWFSGRPERIGEETRDGRSVYTKIESPPEKDFLGRERAYSFLGVKYLVFPPEGTGGASDEALRSSFNEKFPLFYDRPDARVYKNPGALPRVFLARETLKATGWEEAQKMFMEGGFDPLSTVVLESDDAGAARGAAPDDKGDDRVDDKGKAGGDDVKASIESKGQGGLLRAAEAMLQEYLPGRLAFAEGPAGLAITGQPGSATEAANDAGSSEVASSSAGSGVGSASGEAPMPPESLMKTPRAALKGGAANVNGGATPAKTPVVPLSTLPEKAVPSLRAAHGAASSKKGTEPAGGAATEAAKPASGTVLAPTEVGKKPAEAPAAGGAAAKKDAGAGAAAPASPVVTEAPSEPAPTQGPAVSETTGAAPEKAPQVKPEKPAVTPSEEAATPVGTPGLEKAAPEGTETAAPGAPTTETLSSEAPAAAAPEAPATLLPLEEGKARITLYTEQKVVVEVNAEDDSMLVLTDLYYPGWKAKVNDDKVEIRRVNGLVRGVPVKAGRSTVVFYYMPFYFLLGVGLAVLGVIFSVVLIVRDIKGD